MTGEILTITECKVINPKTHKPVVKKINISLKKNQHLLLKGPNGMGKSTLLEAIASGKATGAKIAPDIKVGYYRQDFSMLNFEDTVYDALMKSMDRPIEETMRAFAGLVLQKPGLLIFDEPTNHINFRHLPIIAKALDLYQGAMILVSHVPEFVVKIRIDEVLDLEK
jgi:ATP-binding cassette subfamily F protein 3